MINQNACYEKMTLQIKTTNNQNANFGKPDFAIKRQRQWNQHNFANLIYQSESREENTLILRAYKINHEQNRSHETKPIKIFADQDPN